jgi:hypothetical protein
MYPVEISSLEESDEQQRTQRFGNIWVGTVRNGTYVNFMYPTNNTLAADLLWYPFETTTDNCAYQTTTINWRTHLCTNFIPSVVQVWHINDVPYLAKKQFCPPIEIRK